MVERNNTVMIPGGDFSIQPGDKVFVSGDMMAITDYFRYLGRNKQKIRSVMLLGGGRISYYLSRLIVPMGKTNSLFDYT